jgi:hypothetical protein
MKFQAASFKVFRFSSALSLALVVCQLAYVATFAQNPKPTEQDKPFVVEYYYKAKWGYAEEFIRLFKKNHYPLLKKQMEEGRILQMKAETSFYHVPEDGRWDYRVTIAWKNSVIAHDDYDESVNAKKFFPDQETFKREEQRRFEILLGHWDTYVVPVNLDKP